MHLWEQGGCVDTVELLNIVLGFQASPDTETKHLQSSLLTVSQQKSLKCFRNDESDWAA